ncbi:MAG: bifunctional (p)ppGpp synthetase/guanosine-3',5'-bis(diphosphate) 3'-pyrophosphohydrolase [Betaproteobacteria bacterium]|nr:bifunctional (p)ppGpp synthetase/guanosine-3',5'-bis(diphosphate) 3'-pyrophosphohydrolase [Betaproteobacteria bacterium]
MVTRQTDAKNLIQQIPLLTANTDAAGSELIARVAQWRYAHSSETAWTDALGTALLVAHLQMDAYSVAAALLSGADIMSAPVDEAVRPLILGVSQLENIGQLLGNADKLRRDGHDQVENLRQMLLAMVTDIRVVLIKLAERLQSLRTVMQRNDQAAQQRLAYEVQDLFAPLANRLGVWQIKWEMEDLAYRILEPENYRRIARLLDEKRLDRESYINEVVTRLRSELSREGIAAEVTGRPKHIVSIINKMNRKHLSFEELYDIRAVRILVPELKDCYTALGLVHHLWQPIVGEFDDYIAHPKPNDYRSLHTGVIGPENKALEVQIRTFAMHQHAELGVAAHWRYKEGGGKTDTMIDQMAWLRQILRWKEKNVDNQALADLFRNELFQDRIYVLTPQGHVIDLESGASPVDFAYHVHTDLGHRCRGARVDGVIVPLNTPLKNGQRVEILTVKQGAPSRDWLNPALGYLVTARARAKVRHWFRTEHFAEHVDVGREVLERELRRLRAHDINIDKLAGKLGHARGEEFFAALGRNDIGIHALATAIESLSAQALPVNPPPMRTRAATLLDAQSVWIEGVSGLPVTFAKCCHPAPPSNIVAYITQARGVTVHRRNCPSILRLDVSRQDRLLAASWSDSAQKNLVKLRVEAFDRQGLLRDVSALLTKEKVSVLNVNIESRADMAIMHFQVHAQSTVDRALARIRHLPHVVLAERVDYPENDS